MNENPEPEELPNEQFNVEEFMREKLPPYVVRCFLASGFDTAEVISSMDASENPGNSISAIDIIVATRSFVVLLLQMTLFSHPGIE